MDQLKEFLRQAIKYRFWIAVGLAALLPMIGYFVGAGSISTQAKAEATKIEGADKAVKEYISGVKPNAQYKGIVNTKTAELTSDVNAAWRKLYERQAPLLTWPTGVTQFTEWTRTYPKDVDPAAVQDAVNKYINSYQEYVDLVYKKFRPWDPETGKGVVLAPPKEALLQVPVFDETNPPSDLSKIWSTQEKLWVQAALLEVIDAVNKNAKDWDSAVIKQITDLQVANPLALDQVSVADGVTLKAPDPLTKDGGAAAPAAEAAPAASSYEPGGKGMMMPGTMGGSGGMGMGGAAGPEVSYLSSSNQQYQVVPVSLAVYIDQNSINNLLVELANSPMSIRVMDYEQQRPAARIQKPEKGESLPGGTGGGMGMGSYGSMGSMMMRGGGGDIFNSMGAGGYGGGGGAFPGGAFPGRRGGGMQFDRGGYAPSTGGGGGAATAAHGKDLRDRTPEKVAEERKKAREAVEVKIHDPYYNIVEVRIYGQARFYNVPPAEQPAESTSPGAEAAKDENAPADAAKAETPAKDEETKDAAKVEEKDKDKEPVKEGEAKDAGKADETKPAADASKPKAEAPDAGDESPKDKDKDKAEPAKDEAPKAEPKKDESPKAEAKPGAGDAAPKR